MQSNDVAYVRRGWVRERVIKSLREPKYAAVIAQELKTHRSTISEILLDLEQHGLVHCCNPEKPHTRVYELTDKGRYVLDHLDE